MDGKYGDVFVCHWTFGRSGALYCIALHCILLLSLCICAGTPNPIEIFSECVMEIHCIFMIYYWKRTNPRIQAGFRDRMSVGVYTQCMHWHCTHTHTTNKERKHVLYELKPSNNTMHIAHCMLPLYIGDCNTTHEIWFMHFRCTQVRTSTQRLNLLKMWCVK